MIKYFKPTLFASFALFSLPSYSTDVSQFALRGISAGMNSAEACSMVADDFPEEEQKLIEMAGGESRDDWTFSIKSSIRKGVAHEKGCTGGFQGYDRMNSGGGNTWSEYFNVRSEQGVVYSVSDTQGIAVGDTIEDCHKARDDLFEKLITKYGKPTYTHQGKFPVKYQHLIWDYGQVPSAKFADENYEGFEIKAECEVIRGRVPFSKLTIRAGFSSGKILRESKDLRPKAKTRKLNFE